MGCCFPGGGGGAGSSAADAREAPSSEHFYVPEPQDLDSAVPQESPTCQGFLPEASQSESLTVLQSTCTSGSPLLTTRSFSPVMAGQNPIDSCLFPHDVSPERSPPKAPMPPTSTKRRHQRSIIGTPHNLPRGRSVEVGVGRGSFADAVLVGPTPPSRRRSVAVRGQRSGSRGPLSPPATAGRGRIDLPRSPTVRDPVPPPPPTVTTTAPEVLDAVSRENTSPGATPVSAVPGARLPRAAQCRSLLWRPCWHRWTPCRPIRRSRQIRRPTRPRRSHKSSPLRPRRPAQPAAGRRCSAATCRRHRPAASASTPPNRPSGR
eukprot:TRINITY_DN10011_c0_g1_i2.p1 TRINITY_DN10011_c0_g1~~TRINITY_DN10011_c0_g1_i2.p1  ORF type:complete len:334 (+),score=26.51 TRINITY_DN10011_c0_g1_i2:48-1004(+)